MQTRKAALIIIHADGREEAVGYDELAEDSSRFAHYRHLQGIRARERVAVMLVPCRSFYVAVFVVLKVGAIVVPLFTSLGPNVVRPRVEQVH